MRRSTFIAKCLQFMLDKDHKERKNGTYGNLFYGSGILYSYGYHYPLMWIEGNCIIVNSAGYSKTTSKHISDCFHAINMNGGTADYHRVETWLQEPCTSVYVVITGAKAIVKHWQRELDSCVRPVSKKRDHATIQLQRAQENLARALQAVEVEQQPVL